MSSTSVSSPYNDRPGLLLKLTVALVGMFAFIQVYSVQSILPQLQRDLHASVVEIGNSVGVTVLAVALISPFIGMLSDALGRKWLVVASVFALGVPTALMTQVDTVHGLLILRFLQGLAVPGVSVVIIAYIGEEFRGASMVRMIAIYVAGSVLGVLLTLVGPAWGIVAALAIASCGVFIVQSATMSFIAYRITSGRSQASGLYYAAYYSGGFAGAWLCGIAYALTGWTGTVVTVVSIQALGWVIAYRFMPISMSAPRN